MRITRLEVTGFGRLRGLDLRLEDGLNVIHGPNEAGKSTIQRFIQGMLYGLQKPLAARENRLPEYERYRPWDGGEYRGALEYELRSGDRFRIERDFGRGPGSIRVRNAATGADLTDRFEPDRRHELPFAQKHLGLSDWEFVSSCCLPQLASDQLELAAQISDRLANLAQAGQEDVSVARAVEVLRKQALDVGSEGAPTKPLAKAKAEVEALQRQLADVLRTRQDLLAEEARLQAMESQAADLRVTVAGLRDRVQATQRRSLATRIDQIKELEAALAQAAAAAEQLRPADDTPDPSVFEPPAQSRLAELAGRVRSLTQVRDDLQAQLQRLEERAGQLEEAAAKAGDLGARLAEMRKLQASVKAADEELAAARGQAAQDRAGPLRAELAATEARARAGLLTGIVAAAGLAIAGVALGVVFSPVLFTLAALALPAIVWAWSQRSSLAARAAEIRRQLETATEEAGAAAGRLRDLEARRAAILAQAGAESPADLDRIVVDLTRDRTESDERRRAMNDSLAEAKGKLAKAGSDLAGEEKALSAALSRAGAAGLEDYRLRADGYLRYRKQLDERDRQAELLRQALGSDTRPALEARLAELTAALAPGAVPYPPEELGLREREWREAQSRLTAIERDLYGEQRNLEGRYEKLPDPADLDRRLVAARAEYDRLNETREVLTTASDLIQQASEKVQQWFAPALNAEVTKQVARLTRGAYPELRIDKGFRISVIVDGRSHDVKDLSRGTIDQFYFALRLAITELLTAGGEPAPFILDDSLVHYDDERMAATLSILAEVGRTNQVILLTCHRREVDAARALGSGAATIIGI